MKLQELHESVFHAEPTHRGYTEFLKRKGLFKEPALKGKTGYVLKSYHPEEYEKSYPTLADARHAAPKERGDHWQIFDPESGEVVAQPKWVAADAYWDWAHKEGY